MGCLCFSSTLGYYDHAVKGCENIGRCGGGGGGVACDIADVLSLTASANGYDGDTWIRKTADGN